MDKVRIGIIGLGNQGSYYVRMMAEEKLFPDGVLTAVCDTDPDKLNRIKEKYGDAFAYFSDDESFLHSGLCDLVMIETPHFQHPSLAIAAMKAGLHVCVEKPAGVYTKQVEEMLAYANTTDRVLGIMFNQRTNPYFRKMRDMIKDGAIGEIKRTNWIITDWYRTQYYYDSGCWRATWAGEGGGVLYNQAPHQLDLFQWIIGMTPNKVRAFCHNGKWHNIEVEDDVTAYVEYPNGATGVFVTSTADMPGTNRFEVLGTKGKLVYYTGEGKEHLDYYKLNGDEREYCVSADSGFKQLTHEKEEVQVEHPAMVQHAAIIQNLIETIQGKATLFADAREGIHGVALANAMHLSSWLGHPVDMPIDGDLYLAELQKRMATSRLKTGKNTVSDFMTF